MLLHIDCRGNNEKRIAVFVCCVLVVRIMYAHHINALFLGVFMAVMCIEYWR